MADVVNTRGMNEASSVFITLEAYYDFFSASFLNSSLSTGVGRLDRAFGCVIRTSMKVFSFFKLFQHYKLTTFIELSFSYL